MLRARFYPYGSSGPVLDYLESLRTNPQKNQAWAKLVRDIAVLESEGTLSKQITLKPIRSVKGSVWEIIRRFEGIAYSIYFCVHKGESWLLHYLEKKKQQNTEVGFGDHQKEI